MATWEDGPEYAPIERPDGFAVPEMSPLEALPPAVQPSANAPYERPQFSDPQAPVAALATLVPDEGEHRDPESPFDVVASTLTAESSLITHPTLAIGAEPAPQSAWTSAHGAAPTGAPWGPPAAHGWPAPTQAAPGQPAPGQLAPDQQWPAPPSQGNFPSPGTPQWFGPGQTYNSPPRANPKAAEVWNAATPGVMISLILGAVVWPVAPFTLCGAFFLSTRARAAKQLIMRIFLAALGVLALFAIIGGLTSSSSFGSWYDFVRGWAAFLSWIMLITVPLLVYNALKKSPPSDYQPPTTSTWG